MPSISLNRISTLTSDINKIRWFANVGKEINKFLNDNINYYCHALDLDSKVKQISNWDEAIKIISDKDWNKMAWEREEKEKENLLNILLENKTEKEVFYHLQRLTEESTKIIDSCSIEYLDKNDVKFQYYSKVAAGSAAISCYQASLALATNQVNSHIFLAKFELFKSGHWPLIIKNNIFNIF